MDINKLWTNWWNYTANGKEFMTKAAFTKAIAEIISNPVEPEVMPKIADIAEKALTQWKLHIEENEQADLEDINHLEALEWKKLNAELQSIKSNFPA